MLVVELNLAERVFFCGLYWKRSWYLFFIWIFYLFLGVLGIIFNYNFFLIKAMLAGLMYFWVLLFFILADINYENLALCASYLLTTYYFFVVVRSIFPQYRYEQLMNIVWKVFLPIALRFLIFIAGVLILSISNAFVHEIIPTIFTGLLLSTPPIVSSDGSANANTKKKTESKNI